MASAPPGIYVWRLMTHDHLEGDPSPDATGFRPRFWLFQLGGWGLFWLLMFVAGVGHWSVAFTAVHKSSLTLFGFLATLGLRAGYRGLLRRRVPLPAVLVLSLPFSYGAAALWMVAHNAVLARYTGGGNGAFPDFTNAIYYCFLLVAWSALYFGLHAYFELLARREDLARARALGQQAELRALRLQLNPHFLFNTLNAISTLVAEVRTAEANRMLSLLSEFLRSTLDRAETDLVPLEVELEMARQYLGIEAIRFGDRLKVEFAIADEARDAMVPPMILQPLVENAVRHAILPRPEGGTVTISAARDGADLSLLVEDDGPGMPVGRSGHGVGLSNTAGRLGALYGGESRLLLGPRRAGGQGVSARIVLPFRAQPVGAG